MLRFKEEVSLKPYNTFGIEAYTKYFYKVTNTSSLKEIVAKNQSLPFRIIGGGSNVLFTENFEGLTLLIANKGIEVLKETTDTVLVEVQAGENWHDFVCWSLDQNYGGIENLALIPGSVGAAPIQNIGAYGVELSTGFHRCKVLDLERLSFQEFDKNDCEFGYRSSIFKSQLKGKTIITRVQLKLSKQTHQSHTHYGNLQSTL